MVRPTWQLAFRREFVGNAVVVSLAGRVSEAFVHLLADALSAPDDVAVVVDLEAIDYISGPGLAWLEGAAHQAAAEGRPFVLCGLQPSVRTCVELAGLVPTLAVELNRECALASVAAGERPPATR